jgi:hypothetical protein
MGDVAYCFGFPPSELWALPVDELLFWHGQALRLHEQS